jgi:hypothetical protein
MNAKVQFCNSTLSGLIIIKAKALSYSFGFDLTLTHFQFITSCELCHLTFLGRFARYSDLVFIKLYRS